MAKDENIIASVNIEAEKAVATNFSTQAAGRFIGTTIGIYMPLRNI